MTGWCSSKLRGASAFRREKVMSWNGSRINSEPRMARWQKERERASSATSCIEERMGAVDTVGLSGCGSTRRGRQSVAASCAP
eukprot:3832693-Pleurochrysis_carterae.AAC.4